ncbi:MAG: hypothetical protein WAL88_06065 [Nitrosotalea sp.]
MTNEEEILKKLLVDEKDILKDLENLVEKAKEIFVIEKSSGKIIFKNFNKLNDSQKVCALLAGKYFAKKSNIIKDYSLTVSEIGKEIGRPATALSGPLKQLLVKNYVQKMQDKKYEISYHRLQEILDHCGAK